MEDDNIKNILITGASSGIGRKVAFKFAKIGSVMAITYNRNKKGCEETAKGCLSKGAKGVVVLRLNFLDNDTIREVADEVINRFGYVDILVNNAGTLSRGLLADQTEAEISDQIKVNLEGLIKLTSKILPKVRQSVINVGSNLGLQGKGKLAVYSATKFGVRGFSKSLAKEIPKLKIYTVNPCLTATKMGSPEGIDPNKVATIIFLAGLGKYKAKSGSDINVRDYQYGEFWKSWIIVFRFCKRNIKFLLNK